MDIFIPSCREISLSFFSFSDNYNPTIELADVKLESNISSNMLCFL